ncbi:protein sidekick-1-like protein [Willisornis vidua]|uniref:Protein sidekick-1-like protein n=1 Tax=Willisornis vidua TaxID=1566151 RepID=A0ABQ9CJU4_9PASS|nr:protein sidekick-1-like protein [Willisornis vidua]
MLNRWIFLKSQFKEETADVHPSYISLFENQMRWLHNPSPLCVSDEVAPYFKTEPGLPQTHLEGNRLVLTCLAEGSWPLEFKWLHNDSEITSYSTEYKYTIPALQSSHAGSYQCIVRNRMGALLQRRSEVHVAYMGNFLDTDQRKTVAEGQAAVLNFPHILSYPRPQVTWFRDGHKIIPSSRIAAATAGMDVGTESVLSCPYVRDMKDEK